MRESRARLPSAIRAIAEIHFQNDKGAALNPDIRCRGSRMRMAVKTREAFGVRPIYRRFGLHGIPFPQRHQRPTNPTPPSKAVEHHHTPILPEPAFSYFIAGLPASSE